MIFFILITYHIDSYVNLFFIKKKQFNFSKFNHRNSINVIYLYIKFKFIILFISLFLSL